MARFPLDADDFEGAVRYLRERHVQALADGWKAEPGAERLVHEGLEWGARSFLVSPSGVPHQQIYVYASQRRRDLFAQHLLRTRGTPVATTPDADLEAYLERHHCRYDVFARHVEGHEYRVIAEQYGETRARRSGALYMHHIDEGLAVLAALDASERARRAFCLHPLVGSDTMLSRYFSYADQLTADWHVLTLALELRHAAALAPLSRPVARAEDIPLSPLSDVHDLLRACKLQRYKAFLAQVGRRMDARATVIDRHYRLWLERLGIDEAARARFFAVMDPAAGAESEERLIRAS